MKLLSKLVFTALFLLSFLTAQAGNPFRDHRYDAFRVLPVRSDHIVMMGNSITNMHEWWEALGDHRIINRGVSGAISDEMLANLDPIVAGHPAKAFIMIGTNDIGGGYTREHVAENLQKILDRFQKESPSTKVFVQSVLPSCAGQRGGKLAGLNELIRSVCRKANVTYIDLYDLLGDGEGHMKEGWSFDDLHPKAIGYRAWCTALLPYLDEGSSVKHICAYGENLPDINGGRRNSWGARLGTLSLLPISANDIVFIGDEMIHSGEWHELLDNPNVKNRGTGWGYPGGDIELIKTEIPQFFHAHPNTVCPKEIVLYAGAQEVENLMEPSAFEAKYRELIALLHEQAPTAPIKILSILRNENANKDKQFTQVYNNVLRNIAKKDKMVTFVDIYTPLQEEGLMTGNYVSGKGYLKIAEILK